MREVKSGRRAVRFYRLPKRLIAAATIFSLAVLTGSARAALVINLRFADGTTSKNISSADNGSNIPIQIWATITGTKALSSNNFEAMTYVYYNVFSNAAGTGLLGWGNLQSPVLSSPVNANGSQTGLINDANGDGVNDLGSSNNAKPVNMAKPRVSGGVFSDNTTNPGDNVPVPANMTLHPVTNGMEFLVETVQYHVSEVGGAVVGEAVEFDPAIPSTLPSPILVGLWGTDVPTHTVGYPAQNTAAAGTSVQFTAVPEPTTIGLIVPTILLANLRRRRRHTITMEL